MKFLLFFKRHWIGSLITSLSLIILIMGSYIVYLNVKPQPTAKNQTVKINTEKMAAKEDHTSDTANKSTSTKKDKKTEDHSKEAPKKQETKSKVNNDNSSDSSSASSSSIPTSSNPDSSTQSFNQEKATSFIQGTVAEVKSMVSLANELNDIISYSGDMDKNDAISQLNNWHKTILVNEQSINMLDQIANGSNMPNNAQTKMNDIVGQLRVALQCHKNIYNGLMNDLNKNVSLFDAVNNTDLVDSNANNSITAIQNTNTYAEDLGTILENE